MRLLIADDDPSLRVALRLVFEDAGYDVVEVETVAEARGALVDGPLDVALIDAGIHGGGVELWGELETDDVYRGRALLLTGDLPGLGLLSSHGSVYGKPFDYATLLRRIEDIGPRQDGGDRDLMDRLPPSQ